MEMINELKDYIKNSKYFSNICYKINFSLKWKKEYKKDYFQLKKNYTKFLNQNSKIEYELLFLVHNLEKGMCYKEIRSFGLDKAIKIVNLIKKAEDFNYNINSTPYLMAINILYKWKNLFDTNSWEKTEKYYLIESFLKNHNEVKKIEVGTYLLTSDEYLKYNNIDYLSAISTRHSTRKYSALNLKECDIEYCVKSALLTPTACNRQMVKIYFINDETKKNILIKKIDGINGFDLKNINIFLITYDSTALLSGKERNQGFFNAGLVSMNFCNALHFKGIGSCFLQWASSFSNEKEVKKFLNIPDNERIAVFIGAGYYLNFVKIPRSYRKQISEIYKKI